MLNAGEYLTTSTTDIIEVTAHGQGSYGALQMTLPYTPSNGIMPSLSLDGEDRKGSIVTGVKSIMAAGVWVTVKITTAETTTPTQPANVAVIPDDASGQYQVILESSVDMVTWNPVNPGNYGGNTPGRFFRTRIVKLP